LNCPQQVVAVVDDDEAVRRSMERVLRAAGYEVTAFAGGAAFLDSLRAAPPACVLLDLEMPPPAGLDVLFHLARQPARVPAIIVTGRDTPQSRRLATVGGAAAYFTKPVDVSSLLAAVKAAIGDPGAAGPGPRQERQ
jgi:two-component system response regulator FixJ